MADYTVRAGMTDPIEMQLKSIDPETNVTSIVDPTTLDGMELHLRKTWGGTTVVFTDPKFKVSDAVNKKVALYPDADDLATVGLHECWVKATEGGKQLSFPSDGSMTIEVIEAY